MQRLLADQASLVILTVQTQAGPLVQLLHGRGCVELGQVLLKQVQGLSHKLRLLIVGPEHLVDLVLELEQIQAQIEPCILVLSIPVSSEMY
jgi:hypothetical protein